MTIVTTIHQPSSKIFFQFDRIILLSEGYCIYNGPPESVRDYLKQFNCDIGHFVNPADKLSHVAAHPRSCMDPKYSILDLEKVCREK